MSRPRGKSIQRILAAQAKEHLAPYGCTCEIDFSKRGGHQQLVVTLPSSLEIRIELVGTPRDEGQAITSMRQRCQRIIRDNQLQLS